MNIAQILDPGAKHVFLVKDGLTHAFAIAHVENDYLLFRSDAPLGFIPDEGYFAAREGSGIVRFQKMPLQSTNEELYKKMGAYFHRISLAQTDFQITNRRNHLRYELKSRIPLTISFDDKTITARMVNISEGGMRLETSAPISCNVICHFDFVLEATLPVFRLDGVVVYSGKEEEGGKWHDVVGVSFVANDKELSDLALYRKHIMQLVEYVRQI